MVMERSNLISRLPLDLEEIKLKKLKELSEEKSKAKANPIDIDGVIFDTDLAAQAAYLGAFLSTLSDPNYKVHNWKASEGQWVTMDSAKISQVQEAISTKFQDVFTWFKDKENTIKNWTNTAEELNAMVFTYGS